MPTSSLTKGAILTFSTAQANNPMPVASPTLQILNIKKIAASDARSIDRYRFIISDGEHFMQAMLATQMNNLVENETLTKGSILLLSEYQINAILGRRIVILLALQPQGHSEKIGQPQGVDSSAPIKTDSSGGQPAPAVNSFQSRSTAPSSSRLQNTSGNDSSASTPPGAYRPPPATGSYQDSSMAAATSTPTSTITPIRALSPYQNKWVIRARVSFKSNIKRWSNARGEGSLFNVNLVDESGEIKATAFKDQVDRLYSVLQEGDVYYISKGRIGMANPKFNTVPNEYELTLEADTEVIQCRDGTDAVPKARFNFIKIGDLTGMEKDSTIDIIGVVHDAQPITQIVSKSTQKPITKRELILVDSTDYMVRLTLWGNQAENFVTEGNPVLAFKGVRVGDFNGRSLSALMSTQIMENPDIPEAHRLRGWYDSTGKMNDSFKSFAAAGPGMGAPGGLGGGVGRPNEVKTFAQVEEENIGVGDKPGYFNVEGTIIFIRRENASYPACPSAGCNKKVFEDGSGQWRCEKCEQSYPAPEHRYILSINVADFTGQSWMQCFNDQATDILGISAGDLINTRDQEEGGLEAYERVFQDATFKSFIFRCRAKQEVYNDVAKVRNSVMSSVPVNPVTESQRLLELIKLYPALA
ncbi:MAG: putative replication factor-A protein 1 [Piptocephalis tieghemiana]|nr:MAG: putative replication factor-A protein 1 [Piptocephalis tieghemiana]